MKLVNVNKEVLERGVQILDGVAVVKVDGEFYEEVEMNDDVKGFMQVVSVNEVIYGQYENHVMFNVVVLNDNGVLVSVVMSEAMIRKAGINMEIEFQMAEALNEYLSEVEYLEDFYGNEVYEIEFYALEEVNHVDSGQREFQVNKIIYENSGSGFEWSDDEYLRVYKRKGDAVNYVKNLIKVQKAFVNYFYHNV